MSRLLVFQDEAEEEYVLASKWYDSQRRGLGLEFETEVEKILDLIVHFPLRFPEVFRSIREAPIRRFPYCIYYRVRRNQISVIAVFHQARDPIVWQSRK